ncbi:LapA family protein [Rhodovulum sp. DZ06]|uniref:LapA family protein n=1 Tax=Rhodovulum sp. DZ06 TaxID=3425126 RepID=UPI003D33318B
MRLLKILFLALVAIALVVLAVANRASATLNLLPVDIDLGFPTSFTMPLFVWLFAALFLGVIVGLVLEALRESYHRKNERAYKREAAKLDREVKRLARKAGEEDDDILGIKHA